MPATFPEVAPAVLTGTEGTFYTVTSSPAKKCIKVEIWLTNTHTAGISVSLYLVPNAGSIAVSNQIYADTVPAKRTIPMTIACNLGTSGTLRGLAGTANLVGLRIAPVEIPA